MPEWERFVEDVLEHLHRLHETKQNADLRIFLRWNKETGEEQTPRAEVRYHEGRTVRF